MRRLLHDGLSGPTEAALRSEGAVAGFEVSLLAEHPPEAEILVLGDDPDVPRRILNWRSRGWSVPIVVIGASMDAVTEAIRAGADHAFVDQPDVARRVVEVARAPRAVRQLTLGEARVDLEAREVRRGGEVHHLTVFESRLLRHLASHPGRSFTQADLLRDVWGYAEGVESRTVRVTVQRLRSKIEPDPAEPRFVLSERGSGYRLVGFELPTERGPEPFYTNIEVGDDAFVGRDAELERLDASLASGPVVLVGPGGVGKTRLARHYAVGRGRARHTEAWLVELADAHGLDDLLAAVAAVLGLSAGNDLRERVIAALAARRESLVILDDADRLDVDTLGVLIRAGASVIVTRREPIGGVSAIEVAPLDADAGLALLLDRGRRQRARFATSNEERVAAVRLVERLDGLPLAIELAAERLGVLGAADLEARLISKLGMLADRVGTRPARHHTLEAAVAASWETLDAGTAQAAASLGVCAGGWDLETAEALTGLDPVACADALETLRRRALLVVDGDGRRFRYLESIRVFARGRAAPDAADRHAAWFGELAARCAADRETSRDHASAQRLRGESANIDAAIRHLRGQAQAARIWLDAEFALRRHLTIEDRSARLQSALADAASDSALTVRARARLAETRGIAGFAAAGLALIERVDADDPIAHGEVLQARGMLLRAVGRYEEATAVLIAAAEAFEGRPARFAEVQTELADLHRHRGETDAVEAAVRRGLWALDSCGATLPRARLHGALATALSSAQRHDDAEPWFTSAIELADQHDPTLAALIRSNLANHLMRRGRLQQSSELQARAVTELGRMGLRGPASVARLNLGLVDAMRAEGDGARLDAAETTLMSAAAAFQEADNRRARGAALAILGRVRLGRGRSAAARAALDEAIGLFDALGLATPAAMTRVVLGLAQIDLGDGGAELIAATLPKLQEPRHRALLAIASAWQADPPSEHSALRRRLLSPEIEIA